MVNIYIEKLLGSYICYNTIVVPWLNKVSNVTLAYKASHIAQYEWLPFKPAASLILSVT